MGGTTRYGRTAYLPALYAALGDDPPIITL
jgi:hypothetical protein